MRSKPAPVAQLLPSAHAIEREFRVMQALADSAVPVPRMLALCEDEAVIGRAFYVMEFKAGRILWDQSLPGLTPPERAAHYDEMNRVIAALHQVDFQALGLADFGKPGNYFERQIGRWSKQYLASVTQPNPAMDALLEWLPAHIPASARDSAEVSIVHGDYRMDNLVFDATAPRVVAVLDWGTVHAWASAGRLQLPLHELAREGLRHCARPGWAGPGVARHPERARLCGALLRTHRPRPNVGAVLQDWNFYWPTTCSASRPSCRALPSGSRPARRPAARRARPPLQRAALWPTGSAVRAAGR